MWLSKRISGNFKQNTWVWRFFLSGVFIDKRHPHLGASPGEFKFVSVVSRHFWRSRAFLEKKNLQPHVGAAHCLDEVAGK